MKTLFKIISMLALIGTIAPSMIYCGGMMSLNMVKWLMLLSTIVWFVFTPLWMNHNNPS
ncbi:MAG: hypothetical protein JXR73_19400 [Candidatus Omnitrophica bacterium]|nr:hypothetical protein [Candidatus Omnitrophota bacterium]